MLQDVRSAAVSRMDAARHAAVAHQKLAAGSDTRRQHAPTRVNTYTHTPTLTHTHTHTPNERPNVTSWTYCLPLDLFHIPYFANSAAICLQIAHGSANVTLKCAIWNITYITLRSRNCISIWYVYVRIRNYIYVHRISRIMWIRIFVQVVTTIQSRCFKFKISIRRICKPCLFVQLLLCQQIYGSIWATLKCNYL